MAQFDSMPVMVSEMKPRVNGQLMAEYQGKVVTLLGNVSQVDSSGMSFKLNTSDNVGITVHLQEPNQEYLNGVVEVQGKVTSKLTILCNSFVVFPTEQAEGFNVQDYDEAVKMLHKAGIYSSI